MKVLSVLTISAALSLSSAFAYANISVALHELKLNKSLSKFEVVHDKKMTDVLRDSVGFKHEVIKVSGSRMGLDLDAGLLYPLGGVYTVKGLIPIQEIMVDSILSDKSNKDWFPITVPTGVEIVATAYVFTDPTCGYCRKMHEEKSQYDDLGVQMVVIPWPRQGVDSDNSTFELWTNIACTANPGDAYHAYINNGTEPTIDSSMDLEACKVKVQAGFELGKDIGISGTPYIYVEHENGKTTKKPGYVPITTLIKELTE